MTDMNPKVFHYVSPTDRQLSEMTEMRDAAKAYANKIEAVVPDGPDRTYLMRKLREVQMWVNVAITRLPDGTPRITEKEEAP